MAEPNNMGGGGGGGGGGGDKLYKGVRKRKWGKWVSEVRLPNSRERIWLGSYDSAVKAARAFDAALYCLRGCRANFNFPDTPFNLEHINIIDRSFTPHEIQVIAAKFANDCPNTTPNQEQEQLFDESSKAKPTSNATAAASTSSNSNTNNMHECDGRVQVDHGDMDWTFLKELGDYSSSADQHYYGLYSDDLDDKFHLGELLMYSTTFSSPPEHQIEDNDDPFSHQPFLWNWKF